jgi:prolyl oligopeptidase
MPLLIEAPPLSRIDPVTDILHGVAVTDPYRWLEEQNSPETRAWIKSQRYYTRSHLEKIPGRELLRERARALLDVETISSVLHANGRNFFRKRLRGQEQPCLYMRIAIDGRDEMLLDPVERGANGRTSLRPVAVSTDGYLLLYEVRDGGERTACYEVLDIRSRKILPDVLPRGYLRGFAFAPDGLGFYYVHDRLDASRPFYRAAWYHALGTPFDHDDEVFFAGESRHVRLCLIADQERLGFLLYRFGQSTSTSFYIRSYGSAITQCLLSDFTCTFGPRLFHGRIFAITDYEAPNLRIVELRPGGKLQWNTVVPESDSRIQQWLIAGDKIAVSYSTYSHSCFSSFGLSADNGTRVAVPPDETIRLVGVCGPDEILLESQSFTQPVTTLRYSLTTGHTAVWNRKVLPFDSTEFGHCRLTYRAIDGAHIPIWLVGRSQLLNGGTHPAIMTSYGGYGIPMTPQFSVFVTLLLERGCLFALPAIRGGSEFGTSWHHAAIRRSRQVAYDDFLAAAEWLIATGRTSAGRLGIFGGSNSGLMVGAALTQRPELFRVALCMVPLLDMLRYHLFDNAHIWTSEYGTADNPDDFAVLHSYSPYHRVRHGVSYPATLIVSGDSDGTCNPLHARKMAARLQSANVSRHPILLDYSDIRGHAPVLPLNVRIEALTDRVAFFCEQLGIPG